jgi:type II secretory pathway pseudopilin PulG
VIAIMVLLLAVSLPSIMALSQQSGRKAAINQLLNVFEQSRVAALENGVDTYIIFAGNDSKITDTEARYRAFVVYREPFADRGETGLQPLTKWAYLPKGISFVGNLTSQTVFGGSTQTIPAGHRFSQAVCPSITFSSTGSISQPSTNLLKLFIFEGFPLADGVPNYTSPNRVYFDKISFSRFTGRAQVDLAELPQTP